MTRINFDPNRAVQRTTVSDESKTQSSASTGTTRATATPRDVFFAPPGAAPASMYSLPQDYVGTPPSGFPGFNQNNISGSPNACGPTSLGMILAYYTDVTGVNPTDADIMKVDRDLRAWGGFTPPSSMVDYAQSKGLNAAGYNGASWDDLSRTVASGNQAIALINGYGPPHYVVVLGVSGSGANASLLITDPADGQKHWMSRSEFESRWSSPMGGVLGAVSGYHNYFMAVGTKPVAGGNTWDITSTEVMASGIAHMGNGIAQGGIQGAADFSKGFVESLSAIPGSLARAVEAGGDALLSLAKSQWAKGGFGYVTGSLLAVLGAPVKAFGWLNRQVGNAVAWVGRHVANGVGKVVKGIGKGVKAIGHGIKSAAKKIGSGIKSAGKAIASGFKKLKFW